MMCCRPIGSGRLGCCFRIVFVYFNRNRNRWTNLIIFLSILSDFFCFFHVCFFSLSRVGSGRVGLDRYTVTSPMADSNVKLLCHRSSDASSISLHAKPSEKSHHSDVDRQLCFGHADVMDSSMYILIYDYSSPLSSVNNCVNIGYRCSV